MLKGAYVFHDIPYKYVNINHIVIGFNKSFAIKTKTMRKPKLLDSQKKMFKSDLSKLILPHFFSSETIQ